MKRCPECRRDYYDDTLLYCLDDGNALLEGPATAVLPMGDLPGELPTKPLVKTTDETAILPRNTGNAAIRRRVLVKRLVVVLLFVVVGVAGFLGFRYFGSGETRIESIAVMPFVNASGSADVDFLSDGMAETLIASLSRVPGLNVKARSSVFRYKGNGADAKTIGRELNVQAVLNGRMVQRDQELTLYLELVDAATENSLWKQTYTKPMANLIALQNEIAGDVAEKLSVELSGADKRRLVRNYTDNAEAYRLYLSGRFHWNKRNKADIYKAIGFYEKAVEKDPNYALAFTGLADAYAVLQGYDQTVSGRESQLKARTFAQKALSLDDSLSEAHVSNALILQSVDLNFSGAEQEFKRAIELDAKNANAYYYFGQLLTALGRFDEADANYKRALNLEPSALIVNSAYGAFLIMAGRYEESERHLATAIELDPSFQSTYMRLAAARQLQGRLAESAETYAKSRDMIGKSDEAAAMRASFASGGWRGFLLDFDRKQWLVDLRPQYAEATRFAALGDNKKALDALERSFNEQETFVLFSKVDPRLAALRGEPRFIELVRKIGLTN